MLCSDKKNSRNLHSNGATMQTQGQEGTIQNIFETSQQEQNRYPHKEKIPAVKDLSSIGQIEGVQQKSSPSLSPTSSPLQQAQETPTETNDHVNTKVVSSFSRKDCGFLVGSFISFLVVGCVIYRFLNCIGAHYEDNCIYKIKRRRRRRLAKKNLKTRKFEAPQDSNYNIILSNASIVSESILLDDGVERDVENPQQDGENPGCSSICLLSNSELPQNRHLYHRDCVLSWLISHEHCPFCRYKYLLCDRSCDGGRNLSNDGILKLQVQEVTGEGHKMDLDEVRRMEAQRIIEEQNIREEIEETVPAETKRLQIRKILEEIHGTDQNDLSSSPPLSCASF